MCKGEKKLKKHMTADELYENNINEMKHILKLILKRDNRMSKKAFNLSLKEIEAISTKRPKKIRKISHIEIMDAKLNSICDTNYLDTKYMLDNFDEYIKYAKEIGFEDKIKTYNFFPYRKEFKNKYLSENNLKSDKELELLIEVD